MSAKNMSTDIKHSKAQISKIIQSGGSFDFWLANIDKKTHANVAIPLARDNLEIIYLESNSASNAINKLERKIIGNGAVRAEEGFNLFFSNESMNDIIEIIIRRSNLLIDGITERVKHEIKIEKGGSLPALLPPSAALIVQSVISSVVTGISGRGARRAGRGYMNKVF